jgi:iron complex outermembrane recepter protein
VNTPSGSELSEGIEAVQKNSASSVYAPHRTTGLSAIPAATVALLLGLTLAGGQSALAQQAPSSPSANGTEEPLEEVTVTGSLIKQIKNETATPVTVISAEDLQDRGFSSVADALQQSSFATGSLQNGQFSGGFTPGANVISLFGLNPGYTKVLIDGLPVADYPALYNNTDVITSISGIPYELVDHIDVLPGGQSSIYGSDAIAGVVNIIMKKTLDGPFIDVRDGFTSDGGGANRHFALGDSFKVGGVNILVGGEYDESQPIWGFQRPLTNQYFASGTSPQTAERDFLVFGYYGTATGNYYFEDPADCAHVESLFGGTEKYQFRPDHGNFCGTDASGFYTIQNGDSDGQIYIRLTDDITEHTQLYANALWNHDTASFSNGTYFYGTDLSSVYGYYEDPNITGTGAATTDFLNLQRQFAPEEAGGLNSTMSFATTNAIRLNGGVKGSVGDSNWEYDVGMLYTEQRLDQADHQLLESGFNSYFASIMGTPTYDPIQETNIFTPNYALFYQPITPAEYASFSAYSHAFSYTEDSSVRGQLSDARLFSLPGGPAGVAFVLETGDQGWRLTPDPGINAGEFYGPSEQSDSAGHRSRWAGTSELRMPLTKMLTFDASGRYDAYSVEGNSVTKATYDLSMEFRPLEQVLVRARYGTAFKMPTLADEFQGPSGAFSGEPDYLTCYKSFGIKPANIGNCIYDDVSTETTTAGNPALKPITATVWSFGAVWAPIRQLQLNADYYHWGINNEVTEQNPNLILLEEYECYAGILNPTSPTCEAVASQVTRDNSGALVAVATPKVNVSVENVNSVVAGFRYRVRAGAVGNFDLEGSWTDMLYHAFRLYAGDPLDNFLTDPVNSQEFKSKINTSLTWSKDAFSATLYVNRDGATPNFIATQTGYGTPGAGTLAAWTLANFSARYQVTPQLQLAVAVDNVFNTMPPTDNSYPGSAGNNTGAADSPTGAAYDIFDYNNYGRSYFIEANYHFTK